MSSRKTHKDVEYEVSAGSRIRKNFREYDEAAAHALILAMQGETVHFDVIVWSKAGARFYGGDDAVEQYDDDPEASVFERYVIKVDAQGRVP